MRHRMLTALGAAACAALVGCAAFATLGTDTNTALKELTAVHEERDRAIASRDVAALSKQHAANLEVRLADGTKIDRAAFEALLEKKMASGAAPKSTITRLAQAEGGYVALVEPGLEGTGSALRETWVRTGSGWKLKSVEAISDRSPIASTDDRRGPI